ncbi:hypothetical protein BOX15_Mlig018561g4, partial [Macrostomum lignano]
TCRQLTMSDWAKEMEEAEQLEYQLPPPVMEYNKDKSIKREISYQRDENGNLFKVSSELQVEVRKLSKSIARRKEWKKFGAAESDGPGPNSANTYPAEEVFLQFVSGRPEDEAEKQADELVSKMPKNVATCRICRGRTSLPGVRSRTARIHWMWTNRPCRLRTLRTLLPLVRQLPTAAWAAPTLASRYLKRPVGSTSHLACGRQRPLASAAQSARTSGGMISQPSG